MKVPVYLTIKHEFQGILFQYQMSKFQLNPNGQPQWNQQYAQVNNGILNQHSAQAQWNIRPGIQMNNNTMTHETGQAQWSSPPPTPTPSNRANLAQWSSPTPTPFNGEGVNKARQSQSWSGN